LVTFFVRRQRLSLPEGSPVVKRAPEWEGFFCREALDGLAKMARIIRENLEELASLRPD
jgi:hypothetical protein